MKSVPVGRISNTRNVVGDKMAKVLILKGLPASGKSTYAKHIVDEGNGQWKRVNKDDIRSMLDNGTWSHKKEELIVDIRNTVISESLIMGYNVVVDDTNFATEHEETIRAIADRYGAEVEIKFINTPLQECIQRDSTRTNPVGEKEIRRMYNKYLKPAQVKRPAPPPVDPTLPYAIICDLDGTLALHNGRSPYDTEKCLEDIANETIERICARYLSSPFGASGNTTRLIFVSGREEKYRELTEKWLELYTFRHSKMNLYMRPTGDTRRDDIVKKEIYDTHIKGKYNVDFILDDRTRVVNMWRNEGLTCLQVADGDF